MNETPGAKHLRSVDYPANVGELVGGKEFTVLEHRRIRRARVEGT